MSTTLYDHALNFYNALDAEANLEMLNDEVELRIFRGSITQAYRSMGISQSYYSQVRRSLIELGCIAILQQGARNTDSVIAIHHPPSEEEFSVAKDRLTTNLSVATLTQQVQDLTRLVGGIRVGEALVDHDQRLKTLEREVKRVAAKQTEGTRRTTGS